MIIHASDDDTVRLPPFPVGPRYYGIHMLYKPIPMAHHLFPWVLYYIDVTGTKELVADPALFLIELRSPIKSKVQIM